MKELSLEEVERQDFVDNTIYQLINLLNPSMEYIDWNIEMIADVRDRIEYWFTDQYKLSDKHTFYPSISE